MCRHRLYLDVNPPLVYSSGWYEHFINSSETLGKSWQPKSLMNAWPSSTNTTSFKDRILWLFLYRLSPLYINYHYFIFNIKSVNFFFFIENRFLTAGVISDYKLLGVAYWDRDFCKVDVRSNLRESIFLTHWDLNPRLASYQVQTVNLFTTFFFFFF